MRSLLILLLCGYAAASANCPTLATPSNAASDCVLGGRPTTSLITIRNNKKI